VEYDEELDEGITITVPSPERSGLRAIKEAEENQEDNISEIEESAELKEKAAAQEDPDDVFESVNNNKGLNEEELSVLSM
jgi:vacuolar-type H+-ATPase subunit H